MLVVRVQEAPGNLRVQKKKKKKKDLFYVLIKNLVYNHYFIKSEKKYA